MQQITFGPGIHEVPSWSPTGTQIAFDYSPLSPDDPTFTTSIFVMNSDGSNPHAVTNAGFDVERASPDGTRIAFSCIRGAAMDSAERRFVVNPDGSNPHGDIWDWQSTLMVARLTVDRLHVAKESNHPTEVISYH
jgi:Tol biopolymer transport system component